MRGRRPDGRLGRRGTGPGSTTPRCSSRPGSSTAPASALAGRPRRGATRRATGSRRARSAPASPGATSWPATSTAPAGTSRPPWPPTAPARSTSCCATRRSSGRPSTWPPATTSRAVVEQLARRNDAVDAAGAPPTSADRRAVRLEAEARLLLDDPDGADRRLATLTRTNRESLADRLHDVLVRARLDHARGRQVEAERRITTGNRAARRPPVPVLEPRRAGGPRPARPPPRRLRRRPGAGRGRRRRHPHEHRAVAGDLAPHQPRDDSPRPRDHHEDPRAAPAAPPRGRRRRGRPPTGWPCASPPSRRRCRSASGASPSTSRRGARPRRSTPTRRGPRPPTAPRRSSSSSRWATGCGPSCSPTGRSWRAPPAPSTEVSRLVTRLRRDLRGRAIVATGSPMAPMLERATAASLAALDAALNPTGATDARVAVIPSRTLAAVPWSLLPSLRGRPVTVAPSLTRWVRGPSTSPGTRWSQPVAALYGPGLSRTGPEIRAIRAAWSGSDGRRRDRPGLERGRPPRARVRAGRPPGRARHPRGAEPAVLVGAGGRRAGVRPRVPPAGGRGARRAVGVRRGAVLHPPRRRAPRAGDRAPVAGSDERARGGRPGRRPRGRRGHGRLPPPRGGRGRRVDGVGLGRRTAARRRGVLLLRLRVERRERTAR